MTRSREGRPSDRAVRSAWVTHANELNAATHRAMARGDHEQAGEHRRQEREVRQAVREGRV